MSTAVAGVQLGVAQAGIKKVGRDDPVSYTHLTLPTTPYV